jgi:hypothetical protein
MKTLCLASLFAVVVAVVAAAPRAAHAQEYGANTGALTTTAGWMVFGGPAELAFDVTDIVLAASCTATPTWYAVLEGIFGVAELAQLTYLAASISWRGDAGTANAGILSPFLAVAIAHVVHAVWPQHAHDDVPRLDVHVGPKEALLEARFAL